MSRGASSVTFIDNDSQALKAIRSNVKMVENGQNRTLSHSKVTAMMPV